MTNKELLHIATEFRAGLLGDRPSSQMCAAISWPLQGYLSMLGVETECVEGWVEYSEHVWLRLSNGTIIDPSADQFTAPDGSVMPPVLVGRQPEWYTRKGPER